MNPFRTLTGYALSTLALASGLAMGWAFYKAEPGRVFPGGGLLEAPAHLPSEAGMYRAAGHTEAFQGEARAAALDPEMAGGRRDLAVFRSRRAYEGAPPRIPHEMTDSLPGMNCLSCHSQGGWVHRFQAFAPITPHPEFTQCRQCHVPQHTTGLFAKSTFERGPERLGRPAYVGAPPPMPHPVHMRENCSSCHVGPGAVKEIRTTHPERIGCMQCHVPQAAQAAAFVRASAEAAPGPGRAP